MMRVVLSPRRAPRPTDPPWSTVQQRLLDWHHSGAAYLERAGTPLDVVSVAALADTGALVGLALVVVDPDLESTFRAQLPDGG